MPPEQAPVVSESFEAAAAADRRAGDAQRAREQAQRAAFTRATGQKPGATRPRSRTRSAPARSERHEDDSQPVLRRERPRRQERDADEQDGDPAPDDRWQNEFNALLNPEGGAGRDEDDEVGYEDDVDAREGDDDEEDDHRPGESEGGDWRAKLTTKQIAAIRRAATLPESALNAMSLEARQAYAEAEMAAQARRDADRRQRSGESQREPSRDTEGSEGADSPAKARDLPEPVDLVALVRPQLGILGVNEADMPKLIAPYEALQKQVNAQIEKATADVRAAIAQFTGPQSPTGNLLLQLAQAAIAEKVASKWSRLQDPEALKDVRQHAAELFAQPGAYLHGNDILGGLTRAFEDAAFQRLGSPDEGGDGHSRRRGSTARRDSNGSSSPETRRTDRRPPRARDLDPMEVKRRLFRAATRPDRTAGTVRAEQLYRDARIRV